MNRPLRILAHLLQGVLATAVITPSTANAQDREDAWADMSNSLGTTERFTLRGRIVEEEDPVDIERSRPGREMAQDEFEHVRLDIVIRGLPDGLPAVLTSARTDEEGYVEAVIPLDGKGFAAGLYELEFHMDGRVIGRSHLRLLDAATPAEVVRSDVDLTYLQTDFHGKRALAKLLTQTAHDREPLPGMPEVYKALRSGATQTANRPLVFISGSPRFFKRTLEGRMKIDGVWQDGVALKPFKEIATARLRSFEPELIVPSLEEQVGYKLLVLLSGRLDLPPDTRELLLGDDSEADFVVYNLYHRVLCGQLSPDDLASQLEQLGVASSFRRPILAVLPEVLGHVGEAGGVSGIYINLTGRPNAARPVEPWRIEGLTILHDGAWPLILSLWERGHVSTDGVRAVRAVVAARIGSAALAEKSKQAVAAGLVSAERLDRLTP